MRGFKAFLLRGNVVDLAIGVVIGIAFAAVIGAFVKDLVTPLIAAIGGKPDFASLSFKTYSHSPVWKNSTTAEVKFVPLPKKAAVILFHNARRWEQQTAITRKDAYGKVTHQGKISRMGILVLHTLLFDFLNYKSGRLDPSWQAIAAKACVSRASVHRALVKLKAAGILNWVRRCSGSMDDTRFVLEQDSNAYGINAASQWKGFKAPPEPPPLDPAAWGAAPPLPSALALAAQETAAGSPRAALAHMESDPGDKLALALARLARRF